MNGTSTSDKQVGFAQKIADSLGCEIPVELLNDREGLSSWINEGLERLPRDPEGRAVFKPSPKQTGFAEKVAHDAGIEIPAECYVNAMEMGRFIDANIGSLKNRPTDKMIDLANRIRDFNPALDDPSAHFEDFDGLKGWIDRNFPEEWRNSSGESRAPRRPRKPKSMEDLL